MLRNYITTAIRNLVKNPLYSSINIGGLAVGLAACLLILLFVRDELSYDEWLPHADRIAKLEITFSPPEREPMAFSQTPGPVKAPLEKDFSSDIERVVRIFTPEHPIRIGDRQFIDEVSFVNPGFFSVFDLPMASGERESALATNNRVLLSEEMARKYFGAESPLGKVITVDSTYDYTVVGVFRDLPANTHLKFALIALFDLERYRDKEWIADSWTSANTHAYILFRSPASMAKVEAGFPGFVDRNVVIDVPGFTGNKVSRLVQFNLMPLLDIHLHARKPGYFKPGGDIRVVIAFSAVALLILVIACINFVNLATARSMKRAREVALRKVVGATRGQLIRQHLGEAVLTAMVALVIAIAIAELALGPYNAFLGKQLELDLLGDPILLALALALVGVVGLLGGLYPAIYLSRFLPARVLKANRSSATGSPGLRNALVVFQFAISIALMVCTAVIYAQTVYARNVDLGFESGHKLVVRGVYEMTSAELKQTFKAEVAALPGVRSASLSSDTPPLQSNNNTVLFRTPVAEGDGTLIEKLTVDVDFFTTYGVKPVAGRVFSRDFPTDARYKHDGKDNARETTQGIVVNQTFLGKLGFASADEAVGKTLWDIVDVGENAPTKLAPTIIVGVVPDMHLRSLRQEITPLMYYLAPEGDTDSYDALTIDIDPARVSEVRKQVDKIWQKMVPAIPIRTVFVDEEIAAQYDDEEQRAQTFGAFAVFAVLIACLGLFGLASFAAERRTKEIGLRKVMGASVLDIVRLLVWQFSKPVIIANLIAWPVAFYVMSQWLSGFRYAISLTSPAVFAGVFGGAGLIALTIAWATVAGHAARVASSSPIFALRHE